MKNTYSKKDFEALPGLVFTPVNHEILYGQNNNQSQQHMRDANVCHADQVVVSEAHSNHDQIRAQQFISIYCERRLIEMLNEDSKSNYTAKSRTEFYEQGQKLLAATFASLNYGLNKVPETISGCSMLNSLTLHPCWHAGFMAARYNFEKSFILGNIEAGKILQEMYRNGWPHFNILQGNMIAGIVEILAYDDCMRYRDTMPLTTYIIISQCVNAIVQNSYLHGDFAITPNLQLAALSNYNQRVQEDCKIKSWYNSVKIPGQNTPPLDTNEQPFSNFRTASLSTSQSELGIIIAYTVNKAFVIKYKGEYINIKQYTAITLPSQIISGRQYMAEFKLKAIYNELLYKEEDAYLRVKYDDAGKLTQVIFPGKLIRYTDDPHAPVLIINGSTLFLIPLCTSHLKHLSIVLKQDHNEIKKAVIKIAPPIIEQLYDPEPSKTKNIKDIETDNIFSNQSNVVPSHTDQIDISGSNPQSNCMDMCAML